MKGGRIRYHAKNYLGDYKTQLLIVCYQVAGSLGRQLLNGEKKVVIDGETVKVQAKIRAIGAYSAHADQPKLLHWLGTAKAKPKIYITHGEIAQAQALAAVLKERYYDATIPKSGQSVVI